MDFDEMEKASQKPNSLIGKDNFRSLSLLFRFVINNRLITSTGIYTLGNVLQKAATFLLIPLYTRFLTPDDYGITGLAVAVGSVLTIAFGLGIPGSIARYYYEFTDSRHRLKQFISTNFLFLVLLIILFALVIDLFGADLWNFISSGQIPFSPYIRIVLWNSVVDILIQVCLSLYRTQQKPKLYTIAQVSNFFLSVFFAILFVAVLNQGAKGQLLGSLIASALVALVLVFLLIKEWFTKDILLSDFWISLRFGLPLVPHSLSGWVMASLDRLLLEPRVSLSELGLYNLGYQIGMVMNLLVYSINLAVSPYYYEQMKKGSNENILTKIFGVYVAAVGSFCLFLILFNKEIIHIFASPNYQLAAKYAPLILLSYLFNGYYYFMSMPLFYYKKTYLIPVITISSASVNIALNLWWIPRAGAFGSAWATLIVYLLSVITAYMISRQWQKNIISWKKFIFANLIIFLGTVLETYNTLATGFGLYFGFKLFLMIFYIVFVCVSLVKPFLINSISINQKQYEVDPSNIES